MRDNITKERNIKKFYNNIEEYLNNNNSFYIRIILKELNCLIFVAEKTWISKYYTTPPSFCSINNSWILTKIKIYKNYKSIYYFNKIVEEI